MVNASNAKAWWWGFHKPGQQQFHNLSEAIHGSIAQWGKTPFWSVIHRCTVAYKSVCNPHMPCHPNHMWICVTTWCNRLKVDQISDKSIPCWQAKQSGVIAGPEESCSVWKIPNLAWTETSQYDIPLWLMRTLYRRWPSVEGDGPQTSGGQGTQPRPIQNSSL